MVISKQITIYNSVSQHQYAFVTSLYRVLILSFLGAQKWPHSPDKDPKAREPTWASLSPLAELICAQPALAAFSLSKNKRTRQKIQQHSACLCHHSVLICYQTKDTFILSLQLCFDFFPLNKEPHEPSPHPLCWVGWCEVHFLQSDYHSCHQISTDFP
jgi:hypothetical protein